MQANLLMWANSARWNGWEVLPILAEWKLALLMVQVEVERVKMVVSVLVLQQGWNTSKKT